MYNKRRILVIAGSDSSGGAGLEADQKVIAIHGCYAMTATTALTAQNTLGVSDIHHTPSSFVAKQIEACASDVGVDVVKTGMLASADTIKVVANALKKYSLKTSVIDPVMVATSGTRLLAEDAIETLISELLPKTYLLTPNIPEATLILTGAGREPGPVNSVEDIKRLAESVSDLGPQNVLVKGGHCPLPSPTSPNEKTIYNVLYSTTTQTHHVFSSPHLTSPNTHGTGCSLASAIASHLALSLSSPHPTSLERAISLSLSYISHSIATSLPLGSGSGPINHFSLLRSLPFTPGSFLPYLLSHPLVLGPWQSFTHHPFTALLASGALPRQSFRHYMVQDYLYLRHFARANSLAGYKAGSFASTVASADIVLHIARETELHVRECEAMGIGRAELEGADEDEACTAYSRFILDVGVQQDWFALQVALAPCLIGYGVVGERLGEGLEVEGGEGDGVAREEASYYRRWIENYVAEDYKEAVRKGTALIEEHAVRQGPERIEELVGVFVHATKMEAGFWDMALKAGEKKG
ncbi:hydroxymethylpyrimidine/phosphomethylpyrimidine kinase-like protein [Elsinoe australis]|uniref:Hydroxymethylpyrimidine/phosphomethylpyrimidine kinase-like protein n=1 Tax=Elsinoe australis TaxID=40998 RepID=A0A4U7AM76_9PEZI|nr:hydroxymethylpyrimidine/phosphomethylpyrimidine kinase-like protein [Elsinoe australis]